MHTVKVGPVTFHGWTTRGFLINQNGLTGWDAAPASRRTDAPRPGAHGSFGTRSFLSGRLVTIAGTVLADSDREMHGYLDLLNALPVREHRMVVQDPIGARWSDVVVEGQPMVDYTGGDLEADFQISFFAADPRKFGELAEFVSTGSSVQAFHRGNFEADPIFEITGFVNGYRIVGPSGSYTVPGPKASSTVDRVDFGSGAFTRNGVPVTRAPSSVRRWSVPAGERVQWRVEALTSGTGSARMFLTDTWI